MKDAFVKWWLFGPSPLEAARVFEYWAKENGYRKFDRRRSEDNWKSCVYTAYGKDSGWNKCELSLTNVSGDTVLFIVLRKRSGSYLVVGKDTDNRVLEVDNLKYPYRQLTYDEAALWELVKKFPDLFTALGVALRFQFAPRLL